MTTVTILQIVQVAGTLGAGAIIKAASDHWTARKKAQAELQQKADEGPANMVGAMASFQLALTGAGKQMIEDLQASFNGLEAKYEKLEVKYTALEDAHEQCRLDNEQQAGEVRNLRSQIYGLERILRDAGITIPRRDLPNTIIEFSDGGSTATRFVNQPDNDGAQT